MKNLLLLVLCVVFVALAVSLYKSEHVEAPSTTSSTTETGITPRVLRQTAYNCVDGKTLSASFSLGQVTVRLGDTRSYTLEASQSSYGLRFANEGGAVVFWTEGSGAYLEENGKRTFEGCSSISPGITTPKGDEVRMYQDDTYGITFYYPAHYYLRERESDAVKKPMRSLVLVEDTKENRDFLDGARTTTGEGPTSMTVAIYQNPNKLSADEWAKQDTSWNLGSKKIEKTTVGGREAMSYNWDGLYAGKSAVVTVGKYTYVLSVTWITANDRILTDYDAVRTSFVFKE